MFHGVGEGAEKCISCVEVFKKKFTEVRPKCSNTSANTLCLDDAPVDETDQRQREGHLGAEPAGNGHTRGGEAHSRSVHNGLAGPLRGGVPVCEVSI